MRRKLTNSEMQFAMEQYTKGVRPSIIAEKLGVQAATIQYHRKKHGINTFMQPVSDKETVTVDVNSVITEKLLNDLNDVVEKLTDISTYLSNAKSATDKEQSDGSIL